MNQLTTILRLYFQQIDNPGAIAGSTQRISPTNIIAALNFSAVDPITGARVVSFPTEAELAYLRTGDVYYDTTANNVLKIKT
jgi:YHS domain-containing protein